MFYKSKYTKSNKSSNNYKSNLGISLQSSKYHPNIYSKKKSTLNKKNNKLGQNTWKKQNSHNWNKENDKNYENYSKNDSNKYYYNQKEKRENKNYYNKEYSYLSSYDSNEYFYKPKNFQKNEKKISIDYATTQSNSSSHEESNNNQYNSNDNNSNTNVTIPTNENSNTNSNFNSNDINIGNTNNSKNLNSEQENNNNNNLVTDFTNLNLNSNPFTIDNITFPLNTNINTMPNTIINNETAIHVENIIDNKNINNTNNNINMNNIQIPVPVPLPPISTPPQQKKSKKSKKNKKFGLSSSELDIKKSMSTNVENDFQLNNEPYNKFNSCNSDLFSNIINPVVENTEILQVNVKIAKDKNAVFKLRRFDDLFLTVKLFCEINSIEEKLIKPIITKALCTLNSIYQVYNTQLDSQNIKILKMLKAFDTTSIDY